jgi:hypothetical protein
MIDHPRLSPEYGKYMSMSRTTVDQGFQVCRLKDLLRVLCKILELYVIPNRAVL